MTAPIIAFAGFIGSGKSTAAQILVDYLGYRRVSFATPLKEVCASLFGWPLENLSGATEHRAWRDQKDEFWSQHLGRPVTPRWALQFVATELVRDHLWYDFWVLAAQKHILSLKERGIGVVVDDCRFVNEAQMLLKLGAHIAWMAREPFEQWPLWTQATFTSNDPSVLDAIVQEQIEKGTHRSDCDILRLGRAPFTSIMINDSDIDHLTERALGLHYNIIDTKTSPVL